MDLIWFRCDSDECDLVARVRTEMRVAHRSLPTPGPCPVCRGPMRLGGRIRLQTAEHFADVAEFEVSG